MYPPQPNEYREGSKLEKQPFQMYKITHVIQAGDMVPSIDFHGDGTPASQLELSGRVRADKRYLVAHRYVSSENDVGADASAKNPLRAVIKKKCKVKPAYFLLDPDRVLGAPGGGFTTNASASGQFTQKIPAPICNAVNFYIQSTDQSWSFDWKKKKWSRNSKRESRDESRASSSADSDSDRIED